MFCNYVIQYIFAPMKKKNPVGRPMKYTMKTKVVPLRMLDNKKFIAEIKTHLRNKLSNYLR